MLVEIVFIILILSTLVQLGYWLGIFSRLAFHKKKAQKENSETEHSVSVVICARNEAENLKKNLPHFLNQTYRSFEIIVVNDNSTDHTAEILLDFQSKNPILQPVNLTDGKFQPGKKKALSIGIATAQNEIILLSDADCCPSSSCWLQKMQSLFKDNIEIGLGYSPYKKESSFLNRFIRFETAYTAIQYFSFAIIGLPYMGVGRNLAYTKAIFSRSNGVNKHLHITSGDDDLFINQVAHKENTAFSIHPDTFVYSEPKKAWRGYYYQKSRHLTTGSSYKPVHQLLLGGLSLSHFLHYAAVLFLLLSGEMFSLVLLNYLVRIVVVSLVFGRILEKLHDVALKRWIPVLDLAFIAYYLTFAPSLLIGSKVKKWKR